jgi:uncharacterized UBP type Zn finger protein
MNTHEFIDTSHDDCPFCPYCNPDGENEESVVLNPNYNIDACSLRNAKWFCFTCGNFFGDTTLSHKEIPYE